jgi:hypothetical protein
MEATVREKGYEHCSVDSGGVRRPTMERKLLLGGYQGYDVYLTAKVGKNTCIREREQAPQGVRKSGVP